eukprot:15740_1
MSTSSPPKRHKSSTPNTPLTPKRKKHDHAAQHAKPNGIKFNAGIKERLASLYSSSDLYDVVIKVHEDPEAYEFKAHKMILALASEKLRNQLYAHQAKNRNHKHIHELHAKGLSQIGIQQALLFVYGDNENLTTDNVVQTYKVAHQYEFKKLLERCRKLLKNPGQSLTPLSIASKRYDDPVHQKIIGICVKAILNDFMWDHQTLLTGSLLVKLEAEIVKLFLSESKFRVTEANVFKFLKRYKDEHANHGERYDVRRLMPCLRLNAFEHAFVVNTIVPSGMLSQEQCIQLLSTLLLKKSIKSSKDSLFVFDNELRKPQSKYLSIDLPEYEVNGVLQIQYNLLELKAFGIITLAQNKGKKKKDDDSNAITDDKKYEGAWIGITDRNVTRKHGTTISANEYKNANKYYLNELQGTQKIKLIKAGQYVINIYSCMDPTVCNTFDNGVPFNVIGNEPCSTKPKLVSSHRKLRSSKKRTIEEVKNDDMDDPKTQQRLKRHKPS